MSKHAIHANADYDIIYSGEFFIINRSTLVLDNNSGTFAPDKNLLENLSKLIKSNLPGLNIKLYDSYDTDLKILTKPIYELETSNTE